MKKYVIHSIFIVLLSLTFKDGICNDLYRGLDAYASNEFEKAINILSPYAEAGDSRAQYSLARMYDNGWGVSKDENKANNWFIKAANQGHPIAKTILNQKEKEMINLRQDTKLSKIAEEKYQLRRNKVKKELEYIGNDHWAGEYYFGDGLGVNVSLSISPRAGFVFEWRGCGGLYDQNYGEVEKIGNTIRLNFKYENSRKGFQGLSPGLLPIKWGKRMYLIPPDELGVFCSAINHGREPRKWIHGSYFLRKKDHLKKVVGIPDLCK